MGTRPWLVIIDGQRIFADPDSDWGAPSWAAALERIQALLPVFEDRVILTRWIAPAPEQRVGSWVDYMAAWPFADRVSDDPYLELVPELANVRGVRVVASTFGKWEAIRAVTGPAPELVLTGVSTDCCVISTVLPAADAGATVTVVEDACAGSNEENQRNAISVMALFPPQVRIVKAAQLIKN